MMPEEAFPAEMTGAALLQPHAVPFSLAMAQSANQELPLALPPCAGISRRRSRVAQDSQALVLFTQRTAGNESHEPTQTRGLLKNTCPFACCAAVPRGGSSQPPPITRRDAEESQPSQWSAWPSAWTSPSSVLMLKYPVLGPASQF